MLINDFMQDLTLVEKRRTPDGEGGFITEWLDGMQFKGAIVKDTSLQSRVAEKQGVIDNYTITVSRNCPLEYHDVIRAQDGTTYRVTSSEKHTPRSATLDMLQVQAERWELT